MKQLADEINLDTASVIKTTRRRQTASRLNDEIIRNTVIYHTRAVFLGTKSDEGSDAVYPCWNGYSKITRFTNIKNDLTDLVRNGYRIYLGEINEANLKHLRGIYYIDLSEFINHEPPYMIRDGIIYPADSLNMIELLSTLYEKMRKRNKQFLRLFNLCMLNVKINDFFREIER